MSKSLAEATSLPLILGENQNTADVAASHADHPAAERDTQCVTPAQAASSMLQGSTAAGTNALGGVNLEDIEQLNLQDEHSSGSAVEVVGSSSSRPQEQEEAAEEAAEEATEAEQEEEEAEKERDAVMEEVEQTSAPTFDINDFLKGFMALKTAEEVDNYLKSSKDGISNQAVVSKISDVFHGVIGDSMMVMKNNLRDLFTEDIFKTLHTSIFMNLSKVNWEEIQKAPKAQPQTKDVARRQSRKDQSKKDQSKKDQPKALKAKTVKNKKAPAQKVQNSRKKPETEGKHLKKIIFDSGILKAEGTVDERLNMFSQCLNSADKITMLKAVHLHVVLKTIYEKMKVAPSVFNRITKDHSIAFKSVEKKLDNTVYRNVSYLTLTKQHENRIMNSKSVLIDLQRLFIESSEKKVQAVPKWLGKERPEFCSMCAAVNSFMATRVEGMPDHMRFRNNYCCASHSNLGCFTLKFKDDVTYDMSICTHYLKIMFDLDPKLNIQEMLNELLLDASGKARFHVDSFVFPKPVTKPFGETEFYPQQYQFCIKDEEGRMVPNPEIKIERMQGMKFGEVELSEDVVRHLLDTVNFPYTMLQKAEQHNGSKKTKKVVSAMEAIEIPAEEPKKITNKPPEKVPSPITLRVTSPDLKEKEKAQEILENASEAITSAGTSSPTQKARLGGRRSDFQEILDVLEKPKAQPEAQPGARGRTKRVRTETQSSAASETQDETQADEADNRPIKLPRATRSNSKK